MIIEDSYKHQTGGLFKTVSKYTEFNKKHGGIYPVFTEKLVEDRQNKYKNLPKKPVIPFQKSQ